MSHEFGHCLTIGHVGDGAEGDWGALPSNDIMAYSQDPPDGTKCVSTLDVEGVALRMSKYLDSNGDGAIDDGDLLLANDQIGDGRDPFQVQHPDDHHYASGTGAPTDCPQPDLGLVASGERTDWTPTPVDTTTPVLSVSSPTDGATSPDGTFEVTGAVGHVALTSETPSEPTASHDDSDDDATSPATEILDMDVAVTPTHVDATVRLDELWPTTSVVSPTSYSLVVDGRKFDSFVRYATDANPRTWDASAGAYMPAGTSSWDLAAKSVSFHIPREYLSSVAIDSPYYVGSNANFGVLSTAVVDDTAPDTGAGVGVSAARVVDMGSTSTSTPLATQSQTVTFQHDGPNGNTFYPEESTFGVPPFLVDRGTAHEFVLEVPQTSEVELTLSWTDDLGANDLDLYTTGAASSESEGATTANPEFVVLETVKGFLDIRVEPYFVADLVSGATYTLTATITPAGDGLDSDGDGVIDVDDECPTTAGGAPSGCPDTDGDGVHDGDDACVDAVGGSSDDGCPVPATEHVHVYVDGVLVGTQGVDTDDGPAAFAIPVTVADGTHELRIEWEDEGDVLATHTLTVTNSTADAPTSSASCPSGAHAGEADLDGDGKPDACDSDIDGDRHSNGKEQAHGTDPRDPTSYPMKASGSSTFKA